MNNLYAARLGGQDPAARAFISECRASAGWLVRSLEQRARTILKVATAIVERQERFFELGVGGLRPLTQRAVADRVGLHESTVSRVASGKYLACEQGCFEFRYFFSSHVAGTDGGDVSSVAIRARIRRLIGDEDGTRPLSDAQLAELLAAEGIKVARRTVAKYRESLGLASSSERRQAAARQQA